MSDKKQAGKGSKPRPLSVPIDDFGDRWETIFGKKPVRKDPPEPKPKKEPKNSTCPHCAHVFPREERYCPQCGYSN